MSAILDRLAYIAVVYLPLPDWFVLWLLPYAGRYAYTPRQDEIGEPQS